MKVRSNSYLLTKVNGNYDRVAGALKSEAMVHSVVGNREQFYMPGGRVTLQLRRTDDMTFLDVTRTSLFEPRYVGKIVDQLGGKWVESKSGPSRPDRTMDLFVGQFLQ